MRILGALITLFGLYRLAIKLVSLFRMGVFDAQSWSVAFADIAVALVIMVVGIVVMKAGGKPSPK